MTKRVVVLTDEEIDRIVAWHETVENEGENDEEDDALAARLKEARLA